MIKIFQQPPKLLKFHQNYQNNKKHRTSKMIKVSLKHSNLSNTPVTPKITSESSKLPNVSTEIPLEMSKLTKISLDHQNIPKTSKMKK